MLSKAHLHMKELLKIISQMYNVPLLEEVKDGNKRYDFYFPTFTPLIIEVNGNNHYLNKADGFFFKKTKDLLKYKKNDEERKILQQLGKINLIVFKDNDFPDLNELLSILQTNNLIQELEKGIDVNNEFYKYIRRNKELSEERKRKNREFRRKLKERYNNSDRFK